MEQLLALSKEAGFKSSFFTERQNTTHAELQKLFWMVELQQWLRNVHFIHINIGDVGGFLGMKRFVFEVSVLHKKEILVHSHYPWGNGDNGELCGTFEMCLQQALIQTLQYIIKIKQIR